MRFKLIAVALLVWNLMGVAAFVMQVRADPADLGDPATAKAFAAMPAWAWGAYAIAVFSGTAGAIALLLRRPLAWIFFAVSLAGIVIQYGWTFLGFRLLDYKGADTLVLPAIIAAIALFCVIYARATCNRAVTGQENLL